MLNMAQTTNYNFEIPDDTDLVKDGAAAMRDLGQDVDTQLFTALGGDYPGLRLIKKQTIGTTVSSVTVTDAFSATYDAYKIIITGGVGSSDNAQTAFRCGTTATGYEFGALTGGAAGTAGAFGSNAATSVSVAESRIDSLSAAFDVLNPFLTKFTSVLGGSGYNVGNQNYRTFGGILKDTTSYTSFTILPTLGTYTGGTIYVYGYGAS